MPTHTGSGRRHSGTDPPDARGQPSLGRARIHGELQKLGLQVSQTTVAKYWGAPWQNPFVERVIGSCAASASTTSSYGTSARCDATSSSTSPTTTSGERTFPWTRMHRVPRAGPPPTYGTIAQVPHVGGLHHHYERRAA
jgi:hypothetical protein